MNRRLEALAYAFIIAFLACFFVYPLYRTVQGAFLDESGSWTLAYVVEVCRNPIYMEGLWNAFRIAVATTALVLLLALPLAVLSVRYRFAGKTWLSSLLLVPLILPPFVGAIGFRQFWGQMGVLNAFLDTIGLAPAEPVDWLGVNRFWAVAIAQALHLYPILYLNLSAALANLDPSLEEAARNLGASRARRFLRITVPLVMPGLFAGGAIVFIWAFTELGTPLMLDYTRVTSVQIFDGIKEIGGNPFPYVLVLLMLVSSLVVFVLGKVAFMRQGGASLSRATRGAMEKPLTGWRGWAACGFFVAVIGFSLIPHVGLVLMSVSRDWYGTLLPVGWTLAHYDEALSHAMTVPSIANSLRYSVLATVLDVMIGLAAAWIIVRSKLKGRMLLDGIIMSTLAVPGLVLAFGYMAMTRPGEWFQALDPVENPTTMLIIAYAVRRIPLVTRAVAAGLEQTSVTLEEAARNLGAGPLRTAWRITLPLVGANILAGAVLAFCFAMLEVSDSLVLAQKQAYFPITKAIYELFHLLGDGRYLSAALGVWSMVFLALGLLVAGRILGRTMGALFRV